MESKRKFDDHHCSVIEKKRMELDIAFCNANHDSHDARLSCYTKAEEESKKRELACKYS